MSLPPLTPGEMARANRRAKKNSPEERARRRAARMMILGPDFNLNDATPEQLAKLEALNTGEGSSGVLPDQDKRRRTALARYALRTGGTAPKPRTPKPPPGRPIMADPPRGVPVPPGFNPRPGNLANDVKRIQLPPRYIGRDLIDGRTGKPRPGVSPALIALLEKRRKRPYRNTGRPVL